MRIVFMGSPDFAVPTLAALLAAEHQVVGVVSQPDKPRNRGQVVPTPVKTYALAHGLPVVTPATLRDEAFLAQLSAWDPEVIVVVAYGKILPKAVLDYPPYGCINVHGSLLPAYRGAAPMQRAIMDGQTETGVTVMYMDVGLDTGDMLKKVSTPITEEDNLETVHDRLAELGARALVETLAELAQGRATRVPQPAEGATYAAKIERADCPVSFAGSARAVHDQVRGLSPIPLAYTYLGGRMLKLVQTVPYPNCQGGAVGQVLSLENGEILVACGSGALGIRTLVPEGKRKMAAADFIRGRQIAVGDILSAEQA